MDQFLGEVDLLLDFPRGQGRRSALETILRQAIRDGRLTAVQGLPSSRSLAAQIGLARGTVVEAYSQLAVEGYLRTRPGAATEVASGPHSHVRLPQEARAAHITADFRLGCPDLSAFPRTEWVRALRRTLQGTPHSELDTSDPRGSTHVRAALRRVGGSA